MYANGKASGRAVGLLVGKERGGLTLEGIVSVRAKNSSFVWCRGQTSHGDCGEHSCMRAHTLSVTLKQKIGQPYHFYCKVKVHNY